MFKYGLFLQYWFSELYFIFRIATDWLVGVCSTHGEMKAAYITLVGKPETELEYLVTDNSVILKRISHN